MCIVIEQIEIITVNASKEGVLASSNIPPPINCTGVILAVVPVAVVSAVADGDVSIRCLYI
jgi:hypothetical protein